MTTPQNSRDIAIQLAGPTGRITTATGYSAVTLVLQTNSSIVSAASDGTGAIVSNINNYAQLYVGAQLQTSNVAFAVSGSATGSYTLNGLTLTINSSTGVIALSGTWSGVSNSEVFTITANYNGITYSAQYRITKALRGIDGTGSNGVSAVLSNDAATIGADATGATTTASFTSASTQMSMYEGAIDTSGTWTYSATVSSGITVSTASTSRTQTVTGMTADSGYIDIVASKNTFPNFTKRFTITKVKTGGAGTSPTSYWLIVNSVVLKRSASNTYTPATLLFTAMSQTGSAAPQALAARYKIYENGSASFAQDSGSLSTSAYQYTPVSGTSGLNNVKVELYIDAAGLVKVDEQTLQVISDGSPGAPGNAVFNLQLFTSNPANTKPTGVSYTISSAMGGILTGSGLQSWSNIMPSVTTTGIRMTTYTINTATPSSAYSIPDSGWSDPVIVAQQGGSGATVYTLQLYSNTTSAAPAANAVSYTVTGNALSGTYTGWSLTPPTTTTTATYMISAIVNTTTPGTAFPIASWSTPVVVAQLPAPGATGQSVYRVYIAGTAATPPTTPTPGAANPPTSPVTWSTTPVSLSSGQTQYQSDGIMPVNSPTITWSTPYPSYLKVGSLSAITASTGALTVDNALTLGTNGYIATSGSTGYGSSGVFLGYDSTDSKYKFSVGGLTYNGATLTVPAGQISGTIPSTGVTPPGGWLNSNIVVGGTNLATNSAIVSTTTGWSTNSANTINASPFGATGLTDVFGGTNATRVTLSSSILANSSINSQWDTYRQINGLQDGIEYTFSLWVYLETVSNFVLIVNNSQDGGQAAGTSVSGTGWKRISVTYKYVSQNNAQTANIHIGGYGNYPTFPQQTVNSGNTGTALVAYLMVEQGNKATQWSLAPSETQNSKVVINQNGTLSYQGTSTGAIDLSYLNGAVRGTQITQGTISDSIGNLILNGSFDTSTTDGWSLVEGSGTLTAQNSSGQLYANMQTATTNTVAFGARAVPVKEGETYTFSARIKYTGTGTGVLYFRLNERTTYPEGGYITSGLRTSAYDIPGLSGVTINSLASANKWKDISGTYTVPTGVNWVSPSIYNWSTTEVLSIDNVQFSRQIVAGDIKASAITVDKIAANAVNADKIQAGTITTSKLLVTGGGIALNPDPNFKDPSAWTNPYNLQFTTAGGVADAAPVLRSNTGAASQSIYSTNFIPVNLKKVYKVSAKVRPIGSNGSIYLAVLLRTTGSPTGTGILNPQGGSWWYYPTGASGNIPAQDWNEYTGIFGFGQSRDFPPDAVSMSCGMYLNYNNGVANPGNAGYMEVQDLRIEEMTGSDLIVDGAITSQKIYTGAVIADKIYSNAVTADKIQAGAVTTGKLLVTGTGKAINRDPLFKDPSAWINPTTGDRSIFSFITDATAPVGDSFVRVTTVQNSNGYIQDPQGYALQLNTRYKVSVWLRRIGNPVGVYYIRLEGGTNNYSITALTPVTGFFEGRSSSEIPTSWTKYTGYLDNVETNRKAYLTLYPNWPGQAGTVDIADFRLEEYIGGDLIVDGAITSQKLYTGAVTADKIQAGAITTGKLLVTGQGAALNDDPGCKDDSAWMGFGGGRSYRITNSDGPAGYNAIRLDAGVVRQDGNIGPGVFGYVCSNKFTVTPGREYVLRLKAKKQAGTGVSYFRIAYTNAAGVAIYAVVTALPPRTGVFEGIALESTWQEYKGYNVAPAGAVSAFIELYANYQNGDGYTDVQDIRVEERASADLIVDGAITANKISIQELSNIANSNTGSLNVTGNLHLTSGTGALSSGGFNQNWAWPGASAENKFGFHLSDSGLLLGNPYYGSTGYFQVTYAGDIYSSGFNVVGGLATFKGITIDSTGKLLGIGTGAGTGVDNSKVSGSNMLWGSLNTLKVTSGPEYGNTITNIKSPGYNPHGLQPGEILTISADLYVDAVALTASQNSTVYFYTTNQAGGWIVQNIIAGTTTTPTRKQASITLPALDSDMTYVGIGIYHQGGNSSWANGGIGSAYADRLQIERGSVATQYKPGAEPGATVGAKAGSNLLDSSGSQLYDASIKNNTITVDSNGKLLNIGTSNIQVDNSFVPTSANLVFNSDFALQKLGWSIYKSNNSFDIASDLINLSPTWTLNGGVGRSVNTYALKQSGRLGIPGDYIALLSEQFPIVANKRYVFSAYTGAHRANVQMILWFDTPTTSSYGSASSDINYESDGKQGGQYLENYKRLSGYGTALAGCTHARIEIRKYDTNLNNNNIDSWLFVTRIQVEEVTANCTTPGSWSPGPSGFTGDLNATYGATSQQAVDLANKLNKAGDAITGAITFGTAVGDNGSITVGSTNASGTLTTGIQITKTGIVAKSASKTTFTISNIGSATFGGTLIAATGSFAGSLSAATGTFGQLIVSNTYGSPGSISGGQDSYNSGNGFWIGSEQVTNPDITNATAYNNVYKFSIGDSLGKYMAWDGSTLTINGATVTNPVVSYSHAFSVSINGFSGGSSASSGGAAVVSNAIGAVTYLWSFTAYNVSSGCRVSYGSKTTNTTGVNIGVASGSIVSYSADFDISVTVTDSAGRTASTGTSVSLYQGSAA